MVDRLGIIGRERPVIGHQDHTPPMVHNRLLNLDQNIAKYNQY